MKIAVCVLISTLIAVSSASLEQEYYDQAQVHCGNYFNGPNTAEYQKCFTAEEKKDPTGYTPQQEAQDCKQYMESNELTLKGLCAELAKPYNDKFMECLLFSIARQAKDLERPMERCTAIVKKCRQDKPKK